MSNAAFTGVISPVLTPFRDDLSVDTERFTAFCKHLLEEGCHALAVFGTTSEANSLSVAEKEELLHALIDAGVPGETLLPGTGCCALPDTVRLTRSAVESGAGGVLLLPPFYYKNVDDEGLYASVAETIERVGDARLRVYLYNIPPVAQVGWPLSLIDRLVRDFPDVIVGLKDSSGDFEYTRALLTRHPGLNVFVGSELLLAAAMDLGGAGTITAGANVNARALRRYFDRRGESHAQALNDAISAFRRTLDGYPLIPALKAIVARRDNDPGWRRLRPPLRALREEDEKRLFSQIDALEALAPASS